MTCYNSTVVLFKDGANQGEESQGHDTQQQLRDTFTPELAHLAYIPFCRLAGG